MRLFLIAPLKILAIVILLTACQKQFTSISRPQPLEQDNFIQVYFNHNQAKDANYTEPYRRIKRPGDNLEQIIIDAIDSAESTIDLAVQEFRLPNIAQALAQRHQAGVKVRVILENQYSRPYSDYTAREIQQLNQRERSRYREFLALADTNEDGKISEAESNKRDALIILRRAGIPVIDDTADGSKGSGLMHHKFVVIDRQIVITGSANFTTSGIHGDFSNLETRGNANNLLKINNDRLAELFTEEFNLMWGDGVGGRSNSKFGLQKPRRRPEKIQVGNTTVTVQFSPTSASQPWETSSNGLIGQTLKKANQSVELGLFVFTEQKLADILENSHQKGVKISALIEPEFAFRYYSEGLDLLGVALPNKCKQEKGNNPWQNPVKTMGVPQLPPGDKLHHKFGIIDRKIVITGSHNWSATANRQNDETLLVIENPTIAAHFVREFNRLNTQATLGVTESLSRKIKREEQKCGLRASLRL